MNGENDVKQSPVTYMNFDDLEDRFENFFRFHGEAKIILSPHKGNVSGWSVIDIDIIDLGFPINTTYKRILCRSSKVDEVQKFIHQWFLKRYSESVYKHVRH